jgi:flagellar assembly factor FliW
MNSSDVAVPGTVETITFPEGLVGLPDLRRFTVGALEGTALFRLDSADEPSFGVVAARADDIHPGMSADLHERGLMVEGAALLVLLSVHGDPPSITANLAGPIVIDAAAATARQIVLEDPDYPLRAAVGSPG